MVKQVKIEETQEFQKKIEEQQKLLEEYTNSLKRLQADFENYIKRIEKEKEELAVYSNHKLITRLLTVADHFDKALDVVKGENNKVVEGVEMINKEFHRILQEEGVSQINAIGDKIDPYKHEVVDVITGNQDGVIVEEIQKGYMFKNKVLRPSKVRISKSSGGM